MSSSKSTTATTAETGLTAGVQEMSDGPNDGTKKDGREDAAQLLQRAKAEAGGEEELFRRIDRNKDKMVSMEELRSELPGVSVDQVEAAFKAMDVNQDGRVDLEEFKRFLAEPNVEEAQQKEQWLQALGVLGVIGRRLPTGSIKEVVERVSSLEDAAAIVRGLEKELAEVLLRGAEQMREADRQAASAMEANSKFAMDGDVFQGSYGSLEVFSQGLDQRIGLPSANVREAMYAEHCSGETADEEFKTSNYGVLTTSRAEWLRVVEGKCGEKYPGERDGKELLFFLQLTSVEGYEVGEGEEKNNLRLHVLQTGMVGDWKWLQDAADEVKDWAAVLKMKGSEGLQDAVDQGLDRWKQAKLWEEEVITLRLYTGPMFVQYNGMLRGGKCMGSYVTTLHTINSGLLKLQAVSKVPELRKVYRGLNGMKLPDCFWVEDQFGCRGGVEFGFLSTTTHMKVALQYTAGKKLATVFEIIVGQVDRGANITFLSQYKREAETLFPPLSNIKVVGEPRIQPTEKGLVTVIPIRINSNVKSLTLDQLDGRRKVLHLSMFRNTLEEIKRDLTQALSEAAARSVEQGSADSSKLLLGANERVLEECNAVKKEHEERSAAWYCQSQDYKDALNEAVDLKVCASAKQKLFLELISLRETGLFDEEAFWRTDIRRFADQGSRSEIEASVKQARMLIHMEPGQMQLAWESISKHRDVVEGVDFIDEAGNILGAIQKPSTLGTSAGQEVSLREVFSRGLRGSEGSLAGFVQGGCAMIKFLYPSATTLDLGRNSLGSSGAAALSSLGGLTGLTSLDLTRNGLGASGAASLSSLGGLTGLTSLNLKSNQLGASGAAALSSLGGLTGPTSLNLWEDKLGASGAAALSSLGGLTGLMSLDLTNNDLGASGAAALSGLGGLTGLTSLVLTVNDLGASGAAALSSLGGLTGLTSLDLWGNELGASGAAALSSLGGLTGLTSLNLGNNDLGTSGAAALSSLGGLTGLTSLNLGDNDLDESDVTALKAVLPHVQEFE